MEAKAMTAKLMGSVMLCVSCSVAQAPQNISNIPATAPTNQSLPANTARQTFRPPATAATVNWQNRQLTVNANNSSLNQILRDIASQTGMKIVGGVTDERVFGKYGPDSAPVVIRQLLDGTSSNVILQSNASSIPETLTLSPRTGGITPPNPAAAARDEDGDQQAEAPEQPEAPEPPPQPPVTRQRGAHGAIYAPPVQGQDQASPDGTPADQSPNGARTPQQIYDQLQRLRQQQQQQAPQ